MEGYVKFSYKTGQKCGEGGSMETESMRRKGRQEHGRVCSEIQASIRETYNHTRTHTQTLSSRAGGETARYLAVVAVVAVDCLFVDELTTPLSTKAKLCVYIGI